MNARSSFKSDLGQRVRGRVLVLPSSEVRESEVRESKVRESEVRESTRSSFK